MALPPSAHARVARNLPVCGKLSGERLQGGRSCPISAIRCTAISFNPMTGNVGYEPAYRRNAGWGWIAGAVFLVIVLALAFGVGHEPNSRVASNTVPPPAATHSVRPAGRDQSGDPAGRARPDAAARARAVADAEPVIWRGDKFVNRAAPARCRGRFLFRAGPISRTADRSAPGSRWRAGWFRSPCRPPPSARRTSFPSCRPCAPPRRGWRCNSRSRW